MSDRHIEHLSDTRMQAFLDGDLSRRESSVVEEHLSTCARCSAELDGWRLLYEELGALPNARPLHGFHDRVMASVSVADPVPLPARLRERIAGLLAHDDHVPADRVEELLEGLLPARQVARVQAHLRGCAVCATEAREAREVFRALDGLGRFAPRVGFANKVMASVELASAPVPVATRLGALVRRLVPQTRKAWAAVSGVAVTPAATIGLIVYVVFTHPSITLGSLASFTWWQLSDALAGLWASVAAFAARSLEASGMSWLFEVAGSAPLLVAVGAVFYMVACGFALRVLYRHLFASHPLDGRHAQLSTS